MPATTELFQEGRYRIDAPLAETNGSSVFQGYDTVRDTKVVVKEIVARLNKVSTPAQQENIKLIFANQAKMLTAVRHDSLVHVEDFFSETGRQFLVLESVEGDDLEAAVKSNNGGFALKQAAAWAEQMLDALHYLHGLQPPIIHRFVRPRNVRLLPDGKVKLLAHGMHSGEGSVSTSIAPDGDDPSVLNYSPLEIIWDGLDSASQKVIVSGYDDASEKILKSPADPRSDVYSVGATLYFLLTGKVPVDPLERSIERLDGNADPLARPSTLAADIPELVSEVIARAMMIKREDRYESASAMRIALRAAIVRAEEGPGAGDRELEDAAETLRRVESARQEQIQKAIEQKSRELEEQKARELAEEKRRAEEAIQQKLREAEELRLAAEQRAAEAERMLKVEETARKAAETAIHTSKPTPVFEENLLELTVEPNREVDLTSLPPVEVEIEELNAAEVEARPAAAEAKPVEAKKESYTEDTAFSFEETRSGSKLPLIAGAAAVLLLAVIGGWVMLGSGSSAEQKPAAQQPPASAPVETAPPASTEQPSQPESAPAQAALPETSNEQPAASAEPEQNRTAAKPTPARSAAKPAAEPAKTPEKKKVTVDDLINDN